MSKYADVDRLEESEIEGVAAGLCDLDRQSREMTGLTIAELAGDAAVVCGLTRAVEKDIDGATAPPRGLPSSR